MIRDPATRALNQMWAEEREDVDEEKGSLPHVVPSIGESMAVRLLRAKASTKQLVKCECCEDQIRGSPTERKDC